MLALTSDLYVSFFVFITVDKLRAMIEQEKWPKAITKDQYLTFLGNLKK